MAISATNYHAGLNLKAKSTCVPFTICGSGNWQGLRRFRYWNVDVAVKEKCSLYSQRSSKTSPTYHHPHEHSPPSFLGLQSDIEEHGTSSCVPFKLFPEEHKCKGQEEDRCEEALLVG